ncbi:2-amino-4-hydroxy-6-hydroxymethyldihydropteridine diphosphokinase [Acinetobacter sp. MD2(2019)]|uniref:2-amino-4-hydroxy-6- hydroxymethyldihydropteridine diphosphokinase n=1 Tax=Acinetobacter sp. MD2(2019) TaxID=2605273 RepID=UPI002D1F14F2|nr:2-amino-4-hydroxy-6-hydroxymethyldihydropteridine diphosphokinase [Acinetobacter sp. MD2(2019)]MEB3754764.1 2-amino-4-hydroxy-6-hydroxymethyldihydropteridine diphosphokinase [Acinetobacter sp. MD2(2019)]
MSANDMIFALALASNLNKQQHFNLAYQHIQSWGELELSSIYQIPCRDGVGHEYWNAACLLMTQFTLPEMQLRLKQLERLSGRVRPSHQISLDVDLIAWGNDLSTMQWNEKKQPFALDVKIPLYELWPHHELKVTGCIFPKVDFKLGAVLSG